jgi:hypothetical protein
MRVQPGASRHTCSSQKHLVFWQPPLSVARPTYWFMMQIGMIAGFFTAWRPEHPAALSQPPSALAFERSP